MNPNAAAFALILKQRESLNASKAGSSVVATQPAAQSAQSAQYRQTTAGGDPGTYNPSPFQPPVPFGVRPPVPVLSSSSPGPASFMSAMSFAYPSAFPAANMGYGYPQYGAPTMYGMPSMYPPAPAYPMTAAPGGYMQNVVSHTQLPPGSAMSRAPRGGAPKPPKRAPHVPVVETGLWYCEPCDKEFTVLAAFDAHKATHETCSHPGCAFNATKKVVIAHFHGSHGQFSGSGYKMIDVEGQKFRVLLGQSPEEIAEWRAARRKKFPTAELEEAKKKEMAELVAAGGVVPKIAGKAQRKDKNAESNATKKRAVADGASGAERPAKKQRAPGSEGGEVDSASAGEEDAAEGTGEEDRDAGGNTAEASNDSRRCRQFGRGKCRNGDKCQYSHDFEPKVCSNFLRGFCKFRHQCRDIHDLEGRKEYRANNPAQTSQQAKKGVEDGSTPSKKNNNSNNGNNTPQQGKSMGKLNKNGELSIPEPLAGGARGTLWRKLLEDEILKEENIVLQCLRFLVQNNYLDNAESV